MQARGADLSGAGTIAIEMYATQSDAGSVNSVSPMLELVSRLSGYQMRFVLSIEQAVTSLAEQSPPVSQTRKAQTWNRYSAGSPLREVERLVRWFYQADRVTSWTQPRAHYAAAENYTETTRSSARRSNRSMPGRPKSRKFGLPYMNMNTDNVQIAPPL